jgi:hypothetical protein
MQTIPKPGTVGSARETYERIGIWVAVLLTILRFIRGVGACSAAGCSAL